MAIFLPGAGAPSCGGKRSSAVFQNTANGRVMRANIKSNQKRTSKWQKSKANMLAAVSNWRQLTALEQSEWDILASTLPQGDACGNTYYLSGQQMYTKGGKNRADANLPLPTVAPEEVNLPGLTIDDITFDISSQIFIADITPLNVPDTNIWYYYATPPMSPGVSNPSQASFIYLANAAEGDESNINIYPEYIAQFGPVTSQVGQAVFLKVVEIDIVSGISLPPVIGKAIVSA